MKITMTNAEASRHLNDLRRLIDLDVTLPAGAWHSIFQNVSALEKATQPMEKAVKDIIERYSDGGAVLEIDREKEPEKFEKCSHEISRLQNARIEARINKIQMSRIEDCKLPASAFFAIEFMLENK